jgi:hypothetical protein
VLFVPGPTATPHTTHEPHVGQMRDLTCCSYVSLIVDTRNITGRHRSGNAWTPRRKLAHSNIASLLNQHGRVQMVGAIPGGARPRGNIDAFTSHICVRPRLRPTTCCFPRSTPNHRSIMVRRNIVPQPLLVIRFVVGRIIVALVKRYPGQRISENCVNCVARAAWTIGHNGRPV